MLKERLNKLFYFVKPLYYEVNIILNLFYKDTLKRSYLANSINKKIIEN